MLEKLSIYEAGRVTMKGDHGGFQRGGMESKEFAPKEGTSAGNAFVTLEGVKTLGFNILSVQSWSRANYAFYGVSNISGCGEISLYHVHELVL